MENKISRDEFVKIYNIEIDFLDSLENSGLFHPQVENEIRYISFDDLPTIEKFINWHYDLDVNIEGIEIINDLLQKIDNLHRERRSLLRQITKIDEDWDESDY